MFDRWATEFNSRRERVTEQQFEEMLKDHMPDTIRCWIATRLGGMTTSDAWEGNVSVRLLKAFDEIAEKIKEKTRD